MADPFDAFGSDSEDEDSHVENNESAEIAKSLVEQANTKSDIPPTSSASFQREASDTDNVDLSYLEEEDLPWPSPLYQGDVGVFKVSLFGGGRGFCALKRLAPGTTILVEKSVMEWTEEQLGEKLDISAVRCLLNHPDAQNIVRWVEYFHPLKSVVDDGLDSAEDSDQQIWKMMDELKSQCIESEVSELVELAEVRGIVCEDSSPISVTDIFRMLLGIRYNGLESGVYLHAAMLNHSCHPNCAKLLPQGNQSYSEVVTTREIRAGESLTISYCPNMMSHASRRKYIYNHHRFDIGANLKGTFLKMELVNGNFPPSSVDHVDLESPTQRIEKVLQDLEQMHTEYAAVVLANDLVTPVIWETIKVLEQSILELFSESKRQLMNEKHLLLIPCLSLHLEVCDLVQRAPGLSVNVQMGIISRQVLSAHALLPLQVLFHGPHHFDLARTHLDFANAIGELLSRSPKLLYALNLPALATFEQWSKAENMSRQEHQRVKALYANNAEVLLKPIK